MADPTFFKPAFDTLAQDGHLGAVHGQLAYAYIRVSGDDQAEEGRSGLPRQIRHIHEIAAQKGYRIPWDMVFADDSSGFEFQDRPQLSILRKEARSPLRRAHVVVIEHLDRLSRNADWHQGFLLDELRQLGVLPVFWKEFSSRIERAVMGAISQEGMEQEKRRMWEGKMHKARSGRVTASVAAYGYKLVDANGNDTPNARKETYYAIKDEEAAIVRLIFQRVLSGDPMRKIALDLELGGVNPPKKYKHWEATQVRLFVRNEIYKGDFYAHRWEHITKQKLSHDGISMQNVKCKVERPRSEWIHVPVPPLVTVEDWEAANHMLEQNKKMARRNANEPYLLTGLVRCSYCGWTFTGTTHHRNHGKERRTPYRGYRCPHHGIRPKYMTEHPQCQNSYIPCEELDMAVWDIVCQALLTPTVLLKALDEDATSEQNRQLQLQIGFLEKETTAKANEDEKLLRAYLAGAFDEHEFAARRRILKEETIRLSDELSRLRGLVLSQEQLEQRTAIVIGMSQRLIEEKISIDPPFELKQRIIKLVVNQILLDVPNDCLTLEGAIRGAFSIENIHAGRGSLRRRAGNWPA